MRRFVTALVSGSVSPAVARFGGVGLLGALVALGGAGCSSQITNLTPSALPREQSSLYHFETEWTSNQRSRNLASEQIKAFVVVDDKFHPMERVARMTNRWEAEVPLPAGKSVVYYRFKWDYGTAGFGKTHPNSIRSQEYRLEIVEKPVK